MGEKGSLGELGMMRPPSNRVIFDQGLKGYISHITLGKLLYSHLYNANKGLYLVGFIGLGRKRQSSQRMETSGQP